MNHYLFLSLAIDSNKTNQSINDLIKSNIGNLGKISSFDVSPNLLDYNSIDQLVSLTDEVEKMNNTVQSSLTKISRSIKDLSKKIFNDNKIGFQDLVFDKNYEYIEPPNFYIDMDQEEIQFNEYIDNWKWNVKHFTKKNNIMYLVKRLNKELLACEEQLKNSNLSYVESSNKLNNLRKGNQGSLLVRNLDEFSSKFFYVKSLNDYYASKTRQQPLYIDTRNLLTIIVVTKKNISHEFIENYQLSENYIIPNSLVELKRENDYCCYAITILRSHLDDYKSIAKGKGWYIRDFHFNPNYREEQQIKSEEIVNNYLYETKKHSNDLSYLFSQLSILCIHIIGIKIFIESILLYGIKSNFTSISISTTQQNITKIHKKLEDLFGDGYSNLMNEENEFHSYASYEFDIENYLPLKFNN